MIRLQTWYSNMRSSDPGIVTGGLDGDTLKKNIADAGSEFPEFLIHLLKEISFHIDKEGRVLSPLHFYGHR
jgi:hypothetical protein